MIATALPIVSQQPKLLPLYQQMASALCASLPKGRIFENVLEKVFADVAAEFAEPEAKEPNPALDIQKEKLAIEHQKNQLRLH